MGIMRIDWKHRRAGDSSQITENPMAQIYVGLEFCFIFLSVTLHHPTRDWRVKRAHDQWKLLNHIAPHSGQGLLLWSISECPWGCHSSSHQGVLRRGRRPCQKQRPVCRLDRRCVTCCAICDCGPSSQRWDPGVGLQRVTDISISFWPIYLLVWTDMDTVES